MKKLLFIAIAIFSMAACAKVEMPVSNPEASDREINFQVSQFIKTKANTVYDNTVPFGTYSWYTAGSVDSTSSKNAPFMVNETIAYDGSVWKAKYNTFYWPKSGSIEFISYSPFNGKNGVAVDTTNYAGCNPVVTQTTISYYGVNTAAVDTTTNQLLNIDYMYADKVIASKNEDKVNDGVDSGFTGVPTVFRHALAKLSFKMKANFVHFVDSSITNYVRVNDTTIVETHPETSWDITVTSAKISGFYTTGDCELTLNTDSEGTVMPWNKPVVMKNNKKYNVWTNLKGKSDVQELIDTTVYPNGVRFYYDTVAKADSNTVRNLSDAAGFVMPQILDANTQKLELTVHIKTTLSNGLTIEEDFHPTIDIKDISTLKAWEMNQNIIYTISIKPTANVSTPDSPEDVIITFDPAVADWTDVETSATIQI